MTTDQIYDVVIIGGGVVGCATLFHLINNGYNCIMLEKNKDLVAEASAGNRLECCLYYFLFFFYLYRIVRFNFISYNPRHFNEISEQLHLMTVYVTIIFSLSGKLKYKHLKPECTKIRKTLKTQITEKTKPNVNWSILTGVLRNWINI